MDEVANSSQFASAVTEAANRAEVTALLIRCGYRVYRPEADTHGEDLVVRTPEGRLLGVQMKGRATVNGKKYGGKDLLMLFPSARYNLGGLTDILYQRHRETIASRPPDLEAAGLG
jgi:hypothetical protein